MVELAAELRIEHIVGGPLLDVVSAKFHLT